MVNLNEAIAAIKKAGANKVRAVPMAGQNVYTGMYQIEILSEGSWTSIVSQIPKETADSLIKQATNKVICG